MTAGPFVTGSRFASTSKLELPRHHSRDAESLGMESADAHEPGPAFGFRQQPRTRGGPLTRARSRSPGRTLRACLQPVYRAGHAGRPHPFPGLLHNGTQFTLNYQGTRNRNVAAIRTHARAGRTGGRLLADLSSARPPRTTDRPLPASTRRCAPPGPTQPTRCARTEMWDRLQAVPWVRRIVSPSAPPSHSHQVSRARRFRQVATLVPGS
jgi:hypothetical protein